jgi:hypothetical protein
VKIIYLIIQVVFWAVCLVGFNVAVRQISRNSVPRQISLRIDQSPPVTDLFVGNSLMAAGFEAEPFERAHPGLHALNIGMGSSSPVEHDILLRRALRLGPKRVYYGVFDTQLFEPIIGGWEDLVCNRAMAYYIDPETAIRFYAAADPLWAGLMRVIARIPMLVERYAIWARVEKLRRRFGEIGLRTQLTNRFGRAEDFRQLEFSDTAGFRRICRAAVDDRKGLVPPVADMLQVLHEGGIHFIIIEMPMTSNHRRRFYDHPEWIRLRQHVEEQVRHEGGTYLVASDWIGDDGFADQVHLNAQGAAEFSRRIATTEFPKP